MKTLGQIVAETMRLRPNPYSGEELTDWVNQLQADIWREIWMQPGEPPELDWAGDQQTELLLGSTWAGLYTAWLGAQIDYHNGEYDKYANTMEMFNAQWRKYAAWYGNNYYHDGTPLLREHTEREQAPWT